jgi:hypothetical protein
MKKLTLAIFVLSILSILSCKNKENDSLGNSIEKIKIEVDSLKEIKLSKISEEVSYVKLETNNNCLIGNIDKISFHDDKIFIVDKSVTNSIFKFKRNGDFIFKVSAEGKGKGEFSDIQDVIFDYQNNKILIHDNKQKKIFCFDLKDGDFIEDYSFDRLLLSFIKLDTNKYLLHTNKMNNFNKDNELIEYDILLCNKEGVVLNKYFDYNPELKTDNVSYDLTKVFSTYRDQTFITKLLYDKIYKMEEDYKLTPRYKVVYPGHEIPDSYQELPSDKLINKLTTKSDHAFAHTIRSITDKYLLFTFSYKNLRNEKWGLYNKEKKETKVYSNVINDIDGGVFPSPVSLTDSNKLISIIEPHKELKKIKNKKVNLSDNHPLNPNNTKKADNPIIMFAKLN